MKQLEKIFNYQSKEVRVILIKNQPWFVARDVCALLEHSDTSTAIKRLDSDEKLTQTMFVSGQNREVWLINESGLYSLILTSRKPEAKAFKRWITHEVLPSIRKTGQYISADHPSRFKLPMTYKEALLELVAKVEENERLQNTLIEQSPKIELYNSLMDTTNFQTMNQVAKSLRWGRNRLYKFLRKNKVLFYKSQYERNIPYQRYIDNGYFRLIAVPLRTDAGLVMSSQTLVSAKGVEFIHKLIKQHMFEKSYANGIKQILKAGVYNEFQC
ncbi:BRO family protein [Brevibacillus gelatini]|nr:BRO family protein [Brevibacillus gelatini]